MSSNGFYFTAVLVGCIFNMLTVYLEKRTKRRFIKYLPAVAAGITAFILYLKAFYFSPGFDGIVYFILTIIMAAVSAASLITALVLEFTKKKREIK